MIDSEATSQQDGQGRQFRLWHSVRLVCAHTLCFTVALFLAFVLDNDMRVAGGWFPDLFLAWLLMTLAVKLLIFGIFHQYEGWWRYASVNDLFTITICSHLSALILVGLWFTAYNVPSLNQNMGVLHRLPQAVMVLDWIATIVVLCGVRLAIRLYYEETSGGTVGRLKRVLIMGAGNAGESLLREIYRKPDAEYEVAGFIDDDPKKKGMRIHGVQVLGTTEQIKEFAEKRNVDEIIIAIPSASHKQLRRMVELCQGANLHFSIVPDLVAIASGKVSVSQMREVDIHDLLGRDPVQLDADLIGRYLRSKVVLITGAGGSIGSEMCRQIGLYDPKLLLIMDQSENGLFFVERELRRSFPNLDIRAHICDIFDRKRVGHLFERYRPDVVFHAAAHKHVPFMEENPGEAIKNNVMGTRNIAFAADAVGTANFVMISTDKAVNPTSVMGSSKRIAEMSIQCLNERSKTDFVTVRFGNVLGSTGSVIPIFRKQIEQGGPVTVTHPEMKRYFMTIPEAAQLVLQASTMGRGGEIFVLDMGEPVKIVDLARDLITLSGFRPGEDIEIQFTGMRPGEKLFEELSITGEDMQPTRHAKISIWKNVPTDEKILDDAVEKLLCCADRHDDHEKIVTVIKQGLPEYVGDQDSMALHEAHEQRNNKGSGTTAESDKSSGSGEAAEPVIQKEV